MMFLYGLQTLIKEEDLELAVNLIGITSSWKSTS